MPQDKKGLVAQLGERRVRNAEVKGSNPSRSTTKGLLFNKIAILCILFNLKHRGVIVCFDKELVLTDGKKQIRLSLNGKKYLGWHYDSTGYFIDEYDESQIEICYREDDEEGTGVGGGEYITTNDIQSMAQCIRDVITLKKAKSDYSCQDDIVRISLSYDQQSSSFTITVGLIETLLREYHITITKSSLSRDVINGLIQPFFEWEKQYPVV